MQPLLSSLLIKTFHPTDKINYFIPHLAKHLRYVYITQEKATLRMNNFVCSFSANPLRLVAKNLNIFMCAENFSVKLKVQKIFSHGINKALTAKRTPG